MTRVGDKIDSGALNAVLDEYDDWLWESAVNADLATLKHKVPWWLLYL